MYKIFLHSHTIIDNLPFPAIFLPEIDVSYRVSYIPKYVGFQQKKKGFPRLSFYFSLQVSPPFSCSLIVSSKEIYTIFLSLSVVVTNLAFLSSSKSASP